MSVKNSLEKVVTQLQASVADAERVDSGNKAAGARVRKVALEATLLLKELRKQVLEARKAES